MMLTSITNQPGASAGEIWCANDPMIDIEVYLGYWHTPTALANGEQVSPQHRHAQWSIDVESYYAGGIVNGLHMERAFKTERAAREWFNYIAWCLESITAAELLALSRELRGKRT